MKNTKRAMLLSCLSMLLCLSMLVGSTFAWFTDTATTAVNSIQSGIIDIRLVDSKTGESLEGKSINFVDKNGNTDILWEPGATFYSEPIRVMNHSNLSFYLDVFISGFEGDLKLLEAIDFKIVYASSIVEGYTWDQLNGRGHLVAGTGTVFTGEGKNGNNWMAKYYGLQADRTGEDEFLGGYLGYAIDPSTLTPGTPKPLMDICIVGHMKEEAGNEYQGLTLSGAALTFSATQAPSENDSYGNMYDADAEYDEVLIGTQTYTADTTLAQSFFARYGDEAIHVENGAHVTIESSTTVKLYPNGKTMDGVFVKNGSVVDIKGGTFIVEGTHAARCNLIYAYDGATINISGGTFKSVNPGDTLRVNNNSTLRPSYINVTGGSFFEFDPSAGHYNVTVPEGYKVVEEVKADGTWYTVIAE